ncbi:hypothetical protein B0H11DRAFT_1924077 [Mycena galericulata]|nr:hypothetical protein B0H11DRAFT_1924077 [Mycena galericulata]
MAAVGGSVGGNEWRHSDIYGHPVPGLGFSVIYIFPTYLVVNYTPNHAKKSRVDSHILVNFQLSGGSWRQFTFLGGGNVADMKLFWAAVGAIGGSVGGRGGRQCRRHSSLRAAVRAAVSSVTWRQCDVGGGNFWGLAAAWRQLWRSWRQSRTNVTHRSTNSVYLTGSSQTSSGF